MKTIESYRLAQPLEELERKAIKALRKGWWTQESLDHAKARANALAKYFENIEKE